MSKPIKINFSVGGTPVVNYDGTSDFTTDTQEVCFNHVWSFQVEDNTTGGNPNYTIEVSNDGSTWTSYFNNAENIPLDESYEDNRLAFLYMRIVYNATGVSSGTVTFNLVLKR